MSKGSGSAPAPVDPYQAAAAQYQYGAATANYNTELARPSVNTPYGSVDWSTGQSNGSSYQPINVPGYGPMAYTPSVGSGAPASGGASYAPYSAPQGSLGGSGLPIASSPPSGATPAAAGGPMRRPVQQSGGTIPVTSADAFLASGTGGLGPGAAAAPTGATGSGGTTSAPVDPYALTAANTLTAPNWTENVNLSPAQQQLLNLQEGTQISSGMTGQNLAGQVANNLNQPITSTPIQTSIDTSGVSAIPGASDLAGFTNQAQAAALQQQMQYLQPEEAQQTESTNAALVNSGAQPGSAAYNNAEQLLTNQQMQENTNAQNNAVQQGLVEQQALYGEGANTNQQQFGEAATTQSANNTGAQAQLAQELAVRDQPLNELQTEYGLSNPNGTTALQSAAGGGSGSASAPDILSAFNTSAQQQEANYNASVASANAQTGSEAGLASALLIALA
jgi:hypothetical protein